jgi:hypothetical protein
MAFLETASSGFCSVFYRHLQTPGMKTAPGRIARVPFDHQE